MRCTVTSKIFPSSRNFCSSLCCPYNTSLLLILPQNILINPQLPQGRVNRHQPVFRADRVSASDFGEDAGLVEEAEGGGKVKVVVGQGGASVSGWESVSFGLGWGVFLTGTLTIVILVSLASGIFGSGNLVTGASGVLASRTTTITTTTTTIATTDNLYITNFCSINRQFRKVTHDPAVTAQLHAVQGELLGGVVEGVDGAFEGAAVG